VVISFDTVIRGFGNNTGIEVPPEALAELGAGKRPRVSVQVADYAYTSTVGAMSGLSLIPLSKAHREASGLQAGQPVHVELALEEHPPELVLPAELAAALGEAGLTEAFDKLAPSRRKEHVRQLDDAKTEPTKARRLAKILDQLR
jgi:hypothetical protein